MASTDSHKTAHKYSTHKDSTLETSAGAASIGAGTGGIEEVYLPVRNGQVTLRKVPGGRDRAVLVLPTDGERIDSALYRHLRLIADGRTTVFLLDRHGLVDPGYAGLRTVITHVVDHLRASFPALVVVAKGMAASIMLERESGNQHIQGMVLIAPVFERHERRLFRSHVAYRLEPVRVQPPTTIFSTDAAVRRVFGPAKVRSWQPHSPLHEAHCIIVALRELYRTEAPIK